VPELPKSKLGTCDYYQGHERGGGRTTLYRCELCDGYFCEEHRNPKIPQAPPYKGKPWEMEEWRADGHPCFPYIKIKEQEEEEAREKWQKVLNKMRGKPRREIPVVHPPITYPPPEETIPTKLPPPIEKVRRRDGKIVDFDRNRITNDIFRRVKNRNTAEELSDEVVRILEQNYGRRIPTAKDIYNIVQNVLADYRKQIKPPTQRRPSLSIRLPRIRLPTFVIVILLILCILAVGFFVIKPIFYPTVYLLALITAGFLDWKIFQKVSRISVHTDARLFGLKLLSGLIAGVGGVLLAVLFFIAFPLFLNPFNPPWSPTDPPVIAVEIFIGVFALGLILIASFLGFKFMRKSGVIIYPR